MCSTWGQSSGPGMLGKHSTPNLYFQSMAFETESHCVAQGSLELLILLPQSSYCHDDRPVSTTSISSPSFSFVCLGCCWLC